MLQAERPGFARHHCGQGRQAFTLLEVLMVLALIGLLSGVMISGVDRMLNPGPDSPAQVFWKMTAASRRYALQNECEVRMTVDDSTDEMQAHASDGTDLPPIKLPEGSKLSFLPGTTLVSTNTSLVSASTTTNNAMNADGTMAYITFYGDGTCTPFQAQIAGGANATGPVPPIEVDPWTCGPMLKPTDGTTGG